MVMLLPDQLFIRALTGLLIIPNCFFNQAFDIIEAVLLAAAFEPGLPLGCEYTGGKRGKACGDNADSGTSDAGR